MINIKIGYCRFQTYSLQCLLNSNKVQPSQVEWVVGLPMRANISSEVKYSTVKACSELDLNVKTI